MWHTSILETIGHTPLVQINRIAERFSFPVCAKLEYFNPGGSVKDRIGISMIDEAERSGKLSPGGTIIECTSGNTGAGLALVAIARGYRCVFTTTDKQSREKINVLHALGAEVIVCPTNVAPDNPASYYSVAERLAEETPNSFFPNQYDNPANTEAHYHSTGPELWQQTEGRITHFFAGAGTGGTISGAAGYLKEHNSDIRIIGVDPMGSVYHSYFHTGEFDETQIYPYFTEGVGEDLLAGNLDFSLIDDFVQVSDAESLGMARRLSREEGLFVGGSCGLAMAGMLKWLDEHNDALGRDPLAVVLLPDSGFRYLSKLYDDNWMRDHGFLERTGALTANAVLFKRTERRPVVAVAEGDTLGKAIEQMTSNGISQVPVFEGPSVIGSLTESGILTIMMKDPEARTRLVSDVMGPPFPRVAGDSSIKELWKCLEDGFDAILVQRKRDGDYDIITRTDLIGALASA